ncbi:MAG TPA: stage II sporulation protein P [Symbiobacteriaceae bacterium]|nr:stage II sporulation protein P [Symbiobacteriaceae bacterium]
MRPAARPFVLAYLFLIALTLGVMVRRAPQDVAASTVARVQSASQPVSPVPTQTTPTPRQTPPEQESASIHDQGSALPTAAPRTPAWLEIFRPSQRTALQLLRASLPFLVEADGKSQEQKVALLVYRTSPGEGAPKTFLQSLFPFLREETPTVHVPPVAVKPDKKPPNPKVEPEQPKPAPPQPLVGIYHTHDWESYLSEFPGLKLSAVEDLDLISSEDHQKKTVVDLGQKLATLLSQQGVVTVHSEQRHQRLKYENAYLLSRITAEQILKEEPTTRVLIDIHRDAAWNYTPVVKIAGQEVAQIRCIIGGTNAGWTANESFCDQLMGRLEKRYPGLTLPVLVKEDRYNQDLLPGAILLEIGSATNSYAQAERAITLLATGLADLVSAKEVPSQ